jgi:hypothetical protein
MTPEGDPREFGRGAANAAPKGSAIEEKSSKDCREENATLPSTELQFLRRVHQLFLASEVGLALIADYPFVSRASVFTAVSRTLAVLL